MKYVDPIRPDKIPKICDFLKNSLFNLEFANFRSSRQTHNMEVGIHFDTAATFEL
jgi:hypothetical protein